MIDSPLFDNIWVWVSFGCLMLCVGGVAYYMSVGDLLMSTVCFIFSLTMFNDLIMNIKECYRM